MTERTSKDLETVLEQVDGIHLSGHRSSYITCHRKVYTVRIEHAKGASIGRGATVDDALTEALKGVPHGS